MVIRMIPYPPSFSKIAASTIDPAIGASTCALGSHRCKPYIGILTMNATVHAYHRIELGMENSMGFGFIIRVRICNVPILVCRYSRATKSGKDPTRV